MKERGRHSAHYGPWLVGLGAALWGTESAWRIPLNELFDAKVIVFWEHVLILIMFLPILIPRLREIQKIQPRTWGYLLFSGFAGSAVGTIFFTLALKYGNPTVVNVVLNIQPVISTVGAFLLFGDRLVHRFFLYAAIAIMAGVLVSVSHPTMIGLSFERAGLNLGSGYALICALFWGLSTVAGRGRDDWHVASACLEHADRHRPRMHDGNSFGLRQISRGSPLAGGGANTRR